MIKPLAATLVALALAGWANERPPMKFEWQTTVSAPRGYPMRIVAGEFRLHGGGSAGLPLLVMVDNGWAEPGVTFAAGPELKPAPTAIQITWFSFTENRFFGGVFPVRAEEIGKLLGETITTRDGSEVRAYRQIMAGVAPGGFLALWAWGPHRVTEIARFTAPETQTPWSAVNKNPRHPREQYVEDALQDTLTPEQREKLKTEGVPTDLWPRWHERASFELLLSGARDFTEVGFFFANGERETYFTPEFKPPAKARAVFRLMRLRWKAGDDERGINIRLDPQEQLRAVEALKAEGGLVGLKFHIELLGDGTTPKLSLRNAKSVVYLQEIQVQTFGD